MVIIPKIALSLMTLATTSALTLGTFGKRDDVSIQTTFRIDSSCNEAEAETIKQAQRDALTLAGAALDHAKELLSAAHQGDKYIDFTSEAALDYWGASRLGTPYQQRIFDTLNRATQTYPGFGWDDYWKDRYVDVYCTDLGNECTDTSPAYTRSNSSQAYPEIIYCPVFFSILRSHGDLMDAIRADTSGQKQKNVRNLRSQATTVLHEWLHIKGFTSEVCEGGCDDTLQLIGGSQEPTYKAGRAKLLARRAPSNAAYTVENYVYFAMSRFMQKTFGTYPEYPTMWDPNKSRKENERIENGQPGASSTIQAWELEDSDSGNANVATVTAVVLPSTSYPAWYQPIANAGATTALPSISTPDETPPVLAEPDVNTVICETTGGSPLIDDCVHAFGTLNQFPDLPVVRGKKGSTSWPAYVMTCALAVYYTDDWTDACNATYLDVQGHASAIFEGCENGVDGRVEGHVPLVVPNCPAHIKIISTDHQTPPWTRLGTCRFRDKSYRSGPRQLINTSIEPTLSLKIRAYKTH